MQQQRQQPRDAVLKQMFESSMKIMVRNVDENMKTRIWNYIKAQLQYDKKWLAGAELSTADVRVLINNAQFAIRKDSTIKYRQEKVVNNFREQMYTAGIYSEKDKDRILTIILQSVVDGNQLLEKKRGEFDDITMSQILL